MPDFNSNYPQNPWQGVTTKERPWYFPQLYREYARKTVYNRFVGMEFNHNGPKATELYIDTMLNPHANHSPIGNREAWLDASRMDTFRRKISFSHYAGKMSYHKYDDMISFYEQDGVGGLSRIISGGLSTMMTAQMDKLARDAFLKMPFRMYGGGGTFSGSNFASIGSADSVKTRLLEDLRIGLSERDVPGYQDEDGNGFGADIICITSPGVISDLRNELTTNGNGNTFVEVARYTDPSSVFNGEIGSYHGFRFIQTNNAILYNAGTITHQNTIAVPVNAGDGSPTAAVDGIEFVGQPGATKWITMTSVLTGLVVGDVVTIHVNRTNANGVTNGVDYTDGKLQVRRIVELDLVNKRVSFDRPLLEDFKIDLGVSVYGYLTKGRHIHTMTNVTAPNAVVLGVAQPPQVNILQPVDDLRAFWRSTFDYYMGWMPFEKNGAEIVFLAGSNRITGPRVL